MQINNEKNVWFITGSQHLYGPKVLKQVAENSTEIVTGLNNNNLINTNILCKGTVTTPEEILAICKEANNDDSCIGLILWMHTFSPAKMWIAGLTQLNKPFLHLHTQFNAALPWQEIDMDFMNLNQSAHGDREFGYIGARLNIDRKVVVGHWQEEQVQTQIDEWCQAAQGWQESQTLRVARFGDNMRQVAVTEGNKVSAQIQFGFEVHAYGLGELSAVVNSISEAQIEQQIELYKSLYDVSGSILSDAEQLEILKNEARLELGMEKFLVAKGCHAFTNCFENLSGLTNLPGLATQRLMEKGYGYGGEGDWKTAALTRIFKVMGQGREGGTSFMEDYTYNFSSTDQALGAHMLEVCPSIAADKPRIEIHRHTIGCNVDVARAIFSGKPGPAMNVTLLDMGNRFRLVVNCVDTVTPPSTLPKLPVGHALWEPQPNLATAAAAWIHAGGAHHTVYSQSVTLEMVESFAEFANIELLVIDNNTTVREFKNTLKHNSLYFRLNNGI
ncbi:MAG TPA: L-arabinose isomerase [Psychromonas sp.]